MFKIAFALDQVCREEQLAPLVLFGAIKPFFAESSISVSIRDAAAYSLGIVLG